ncbi:hypothetical protein M427DRAFT_240459 [Gonapodya prolifera JEL478]|uniref:Zn(2)-C6 fungal-type domain-containing protein n=1 Tax=Gonapodya prolifera (strain JEL478) TaxID=1344416 RepID=A0A138ZXQ7_GONPJ|nr:hypothetical protein M427DRAFT_240459 [Gonapodya prolifera JEL478]|eukprot:KXS09266.1 hypothetical protein M427DRAFT_240459 [Gonapodya prolifera JEL478]
MTGIENSCHTPVGFISTSTHRCDSRHPRCSYCELRDLVCDYSWEQKPRGPQADPTSARSARRKRRVERDHVVPDSHYLRPPGTFLRDSPESDLSSRSSRSSSPYISLATREDAAGTFLPDTFFQPEELALGNVFIDGTEPKVRNTRCSPRCRTPMPD